VYADSSALVKLIVDEPESDALESYVASGPQLATSRIALVEVARATTLANPAPEVREETVRVLESCMLVDVSAALLRSAAALTTASVRTLDAVHLASALRVEADELVAYDRRLLRAAVANGLQVTSPGVASASG
jgi:uncharacterized protein